MILKHGDEINKLPPIIDSLIEADSNIHVELGSLVMNMKKEVREVIDSFLSWHNMMREGFKYIVPNVRC